MTQERHNAEDRIFLETAKIATQSRIWGTEMRIRLNRWQRVAIVLSVLAFVGMGLYAWVFEARQRDHFYLLQLSMCNATLQMENDLLRDIGKEEDRDKRQAAVQAENESCKSEAPATLRKSFHASLERMPLFLATVLGLIVLAWLIEWFVVEIVRWIKRGSQRSRRTRI